MIDYLKNSTTVQNSPFHLLRFQQQLVRVINTFVRCLPVDVLQDINSWHVSPLRQLKLLAWLRMIICEYMVLNFEHPNLE